jgi:hypothetical protein
MHTERQATGFILKFALIVGKVWLLPQGLIQHFDHNNMTKQVMGRFKSDPKSTPPQFFIEGIFSTLERSANQRSHNEFAW